MKTYILKYPVYNSIDFPEGTIVKLTGQNHPCFEVAEGILKGKKGDIADGIKGWVVDDTPENRAIFLAMKKDIKRLEDEISLVQIKWKSLPNSKI